MLETSVRFQKAIRSSGRRKTILRVREAFDAGSNILYDNVPVVDGSMTVDRNADIRRSATVTIGNSDLVELFKTDDVSPFGMEVEILHGLVYIDGEEELVRLGFFTIDGFEWDEGGSQPLPTLELLDRTQVIIRAKLEFATDYSGYMARDVIDQVLTGVIEPDWVVIDGSLSDVRLPGGSTFDDSRWDVIKACAEAMGAEAYFDRDGILRVSAIKDPTATLAASVFSFNTGEEFDEVGGDGQDYIRKADRGILVSAKRSIDRKQTYNAVIVYGAAPGDSTAQPYAIAKDNDELSPTYYEGSFGKSIYRIDNQLLTNSSQCANAAVAELKSRLGYSRGLAFSAISNPALDEGDYCTFRFGDGAEEVHLLDSFTLPFASGDLSGETRTSPARQTTSVSITRGAVLLERKPSAPGKPILKARGSSYVSISWRSSARAATPIERYDIYNRERHIKTVSGSSLKTVITGLLSGTPYALSIVAVDFSGNESERSPALSVRTTGTTAPPSHPQVTTAEYSAIWSGSYRSSNALVTKFDDQCYQGYKNDGLGNMRSLIGFDWNQIQRDLDGAYPERAYITLYYSNWAVKTGGIAVIGFHNYTAGGRPATWDDSKVFQDRIRSSGWPKAGRRAVSLGQGVAQAFKVGKYRGIALGPAPTTNRAYRGACEGANTGSVSPVLTIRYSREV